MFWRGGICGNEMPMEGGETRRSRKRKVRDEGMRRSHVVRKLKRGGRWSGTKIFLPIERYAEYSTATKQWLNYLLVVQVGREMQSSGCVCSFAELFA